MKKIILLTIVAVFVFMSGCNGDSRRPADLPKLYPILITVTSEGAPLEKASVILVADPQSKYQSLATTDSGGKAEIVTYGYKGAPEGRYKVIIERTLDDDLVYGKDTSGEQAVVSYTTYRTIDSVTYKKETTPFEVEVPTKPEQSTTFDVGKTVKVKL